MPASTIWIALAVEVFEFVARRADARIERPVGRQKIRTRDVLAIGREFFAELGILVLVEPDHDEALRFLHDRRVVEHLAVVRAVGTPLGEEDEADRLLLLLRAATPAS
jgi:hypothetical protein